MQRGHLVPFGGECLVQLMQAQYPPYLRTKTSLGKKVFVVVVTSSALLFLLYLLFFAKDQQGKSVLMRKQEQEIDQTSHDSNRSIPSLLIKSNHQQSPLQDINAFPLLPNDNNVFIRYLNESSKQTSQQIAVVQKICNGTLNTTPYPNVRQLIIGKHVKIDTMIINNTSLENFSYSSSSLSGLSFINNSKLRVFQNSSLPNLALLTFQTTIITTYNNVSLGKLKHLKYVNSTLVQVPPLDLGVTQLVLRSNKLDKLNLSRFQKLQIVDIRQNPIKQLVLTQHLSQITLSLPGLQSLELSNISHQTMNLTLPSLKTLKISDSELARFDMYVFQSLERLVLYQNKINTFSLNIMPKLQELIIIEPLLKTILLEGASHLKSINLSASLLNTASFENLVGLSNVSFIAPILKSLTLVNLSCFSLSDNTESPLEYLYIQNLPLELESISFPHLRNLTIIGTPLPDIFDFNFPLLRALVAKDSGSKRFKFEIDAPNLQLLQLQRLNISLLNVTKYPKANLILDIPALEQLVALNNPQIDDDFAWSSLTKLKRLSLSKTGLSLIRLSEFTRLEYLHIGKGTLSSIQISNSHSLKELSIQENVVGEISLSGINNLKTLTINISYPFFDLLTLQNVNLDGFENITTPNLQRMKVEDVDFAKAQPFSIGLKSLISLELTNSNIQKFNRTKFPKLVDFQYFNCPNLVVISGNGPDDSYRTISEVGKSKPGYSLDRFPPQKGLFQLLRSAGLSRNVVVTKPCVVVCG